MNTIKLKGFLKNIKPSHTINDIVYEKADLVVPRPDGKEDIVNIRFKKFANNYREDQQIELSGNIRSYSTQKEDGKNKVQIYVFTYFDLPEYDVAKPTMNEFEVDGRVCKIDGIRVTANGRKNIHFIVANNMIVSGGQQKLNAYLPCIAWGDTALKLSKVKVNDKITIYGELHSREYKKVLDNGEIEIRVAHELLVNDFVVG